MTANHDPDDHDLERRRQPGVSGDLVAPLRTLRELFGPDQVEVVDVTPNPAQPASSRAWHRGRQQREERQR